jgi:hypothetical protein
MKTEISWAERFINYMTNTKLYIRGERKCKNYLETLALHQEVVTSLLPLFEQLKEEAYTQGYRDATRGDPSVYDMGEDI